MKARFPGKCSGGGDPVAVGEEIVKDQYGWSHPAHKRANFARDINRPPAYVTDPNAYQPDIADERSSSGGWQTRGQANAEYARGLAEGREYSMNRRVYGDALAEQWEMEAEMGRYNRGEDY